jgi:leucine dehydrogenase
MELLLEKLEDAGAQQLTVFTDASSGLRAFLVIDDTTLGPAAGGTRTCGYESASDAIDDARRLARAMTFKCALSGVDAGGAKMVVMDRPELDRAAAFAVLGQRLEEMGGRFMTAGDLGTSLADLEFMASRSRWVRTDEIGMSVMVARGVEGCARACAEITGHDGLEGLRIGVQGCGSIGNAVARQFAAAGAQLIVADIDADAAATTAAAVGGTAVPAGEISGADIDLLAPCAAGGLLTSQVAGELRAWAVCGAANNILAGPEVEAVLQERQVLFVPDIVSSSGAVILGVCDFQKRDNQEELLAGLARTTRELLQESIASGEPTTQLAERRARARITDR